MWGQEGGQAEELRKTCVVCVLSKIGSTNSRNTVRHHRTWTNETRSANPRKVRLARNIYAINSIWIRKLDRFSSLLFFKAVEGVMGLIPRW